MPTADDLYRDILDFLARGTSAKSAEGPHDINIGVPTAAAPAWGNPTHLSHLASGLLPTCTLGKGERSTHTELHAFLASLAVGNLPKYCAISEFPFCRTTHTLDCIMLDGKGKPLAAIEVKHWSIHQGPARALLNSPKFSIDSDYAKCIGRTIKLPGFPTAGSSLPLIQIGLLTSVFACAPHHGPSHPVNFLSKPYIKALPPNPTTLAAFATDVVAWWASPGSSLAPPNQRYSHKHAKWGWGPEEAFSIPASGATTVTVTGRVGYVLVMTPPVPDPVCANTPT